MKVMTGNHPPPEIGLNGKPVDKEGKTDGDVYVENHVMSL